MRRIAEVAGRVLRPLSALLKTNLKLDNGSQSDENLWTVSVSGANLVVRSAEGRQFSEMERQFLHPTRD